jgi:predicted TIM-barrel fold metal-dependent hydrolase
MNAYVWRRDNKKGELSHAELIASLDNALERHPKTTFIACHFANCSYNLNILGDMFEKYPNLHADISARYAETAPIPRFVNAFFEKYQDRLLYGTDMGFDMDMYRITFRILESTDEHFYKTEQFGYHWALNGFGLSDQVLNKVYYKNAQNLIKDRDRS